jgi:hypothetical protein
MCCKKKIKIRIVKKNIGSFFAYITLWVFGLEMKSLTTITIIIIISTITITIIIIIIISSITMIRTCRKVRTKTCR